MELKYEELVKSHWERLNSKLRMFSEDAGPEFLDTWVPDEDHTISIFGIFEAAANVNVTDLAVVIKPETAKGVNPAALKEKLAILGEMGISQRGSDTVITLKFSKAKSGLGAVNKIQAKKKTVAAIDMARANGAKDIPLVHEVHKAGIEKAAKNIRFEGKAQAGADQELFEASDSGVTLGVVINKKGIVVTAKHQGAKETAHKAILDQMCEFLPGRPLQEGRDHVIIRIENKFRNPNIKWPVQGLVTAENTSSAFKLPQDLIRKVFKNYVEKDRVKVEWNFWDDPASDTWMNASKEQKMEKAQEVLRHAAQELGVDPKIVEVVDVVNHTRIMIGYNVNTIKLDFASKMIKMEKMAKELLEPRLELHLEDLEDRNKRDSRTGRVSVEIPLQNK